MCSRYDREDDAVQMHAAISDVTPPPFRNRIDRQLRDSAMAAGQLTRLAVQALDPDVQSEEISRSVVGVQLIYEGLKLTRTLVRFPPWVDDSVSDANLKILVAEVLLARGFSLLAPTEASTEAIEVIRAFGRDETNRHEEKGDSDIPARALEADVFELSIVAGITAIGATPPGGIREFAVELAESLDNEFDDAAFEFSETILEDIDELISKHK